jgi:nucleotide-binding universal stress UspA family protein
MNVLVALDSSAKAQAALAAVLACVWPVATNFKLLTVLPFRSDEIANSHEFGANIDQAHCLINWATSEIEARNQDSIVSGQIELGDPARRIMALVDSWPAGIVVVGCHENGPPQRTSMGSVSKEVLSKANSSVLVARNLAISRSLFTPLNRVLLAIDGRAISRVAINAVLSSQWPKNTKFLLLTVSKSAHRASSCEPNNLIVAAGQPGLTSARPEHASMIDSVAIQFERSFGSGCVECAEVEGRPEEVILRTARDWGAQLVTLGSHGRPNWTRRLLGSISQTVAFHAPCSVQVISSNVAFCNLPVRSQRMAQQAGAASGF